MSVRSAFGVAGVPSAIARAEAPGAEEAMREFAITTQARGAAFLAQVLHESGRLRCFEELASGAAYEGRADLGNTHPGDGRRYKGRGPIRLTGRSNYRVAGKALELPLEQQPLLAAHHDVGWRIAGWYWRARGLNGHADRDDFRRITRLINGGQNGAADRVALWAICKRQDCVPVDPWAGYTASERRWIKEYDLLAHERENIARRRVLRHLLSERADTIAALAGPRAGGGDGRGWDYANRRRRYRSLRARSR
jgi:predicted chitinase